MIYFLAFWSFQKSYQNLLSIFVTLRFKLHYFLLYLPNGLAKKVIMFLTHRRIMFNAMQKVLFPEAILKIYIPCYIFMPLYLEGEPFSSYCWIVLIIAIIYYVRNSKKAGFMQITFSAMLSCFCYIQVIYNFCFKFKPTVYSRRKVYGLKTSIMHMLLKFFYTKTLKKVFSICIPTVFRYDFHIIGSTIPIHNNQILQITNHSIIQYICIWKLLAPTIYDKCRKLKLRKEKRKEMQTKKSGK